MARDRFINHVNRVRINNEGLQRLRDKQFDKQTNEWLHEAEKSLSKREKMVKTG